jgi:hypothetical protein
MIDYIVDSSLYHRDIYEEGDTVVVPPDPSGAFFTFNYWSPTPPETMPARDISINANITRTGFVKDGFLFKYIDGQGSKVEIAAESSTSLSGAVEIPNEVIYNDGTSIYHTVKRIASGGFRGCDDITSVYIPDTIDTSTDGGFDDCSSLETVYIADTSLMSVMPTTFRNCPALTEIYPPTTLLEFNDDCIAGNTGVTVKFTEPVQAQYNQWYVDLNHDGNIYYFFRYDAPRTKSFSSLGANTIYLSL